MKTYNFSAGPCILPKEVLMKASAAVLDFEYNLSLIEISHRSYAFVDVMDKAVNLVKELLEVPEGYSVLFLQGGASLQFTMVAMNLMKNKQSAAYLNTGTWSSKAIKEAERFGKVYIVGDSSDKNFNYIPKRYELPSNDVGWPVVDYIHCTSNNTIYGTQMRKFPERQNDIKIVCDMSSDIFSRRIDVSEFDLIYAGAQKNMGPAGATLVIVKDKILNNNTSNIPTMLNYQTHIEKKSMFNTPPVFSIYVSMLTLQWLKDNGGVDAIEKINEKKAKLLYDEIDRNELFYGTAEIEDRSNMNVCFLLEDTFNNLEEDITNELDSDFDSLCDEAGIVGIKGHRSVGGYRASIYNAMSIEGIEVLISVMQKLETKYLDRKYD